MKEITKEEMTVLKERDLIRNSHLGYVDKNGNKVGYCKTCNKRYIEDSYADTAKRILHG